MNPSNNQHFNPNNVPPYPNTFFPLQYPNYGYYPPPVYYQPFVPANNFITYPNHIYANHQHMMQPNPMYIQQMQPQQSMPPMNIERLHTMAPIVEPQQIVQPQVEVSCHCSKSGCQKDYCKCFRLGKICNESCRCIDCFNTDQEELRNKKKIKGKIKCNCKKTSCYNKYCECRANGVKCGQECNCVNCRNQ